MATVILETAAWAQEQFGACQLGDTRRNKRMVKLAMQVASRPDGSTPEQTESWGDCKAAYRLFDSGDVSFAEIIAPWLDEGIIFRIAAAFEQARPWASHWPSFAR